MCAFADVSDFKCRDLKMFLFKLGTELQKLIKMRAKCAQLRTREQVFTLHVCVCIYTIPFHRFASLFFLLCLVLLVKI